MKDLIKKIVNSLLAVVVAFVIVMVTFHMTKYDTEKLAANVLDPGGGLGYANADMFTTADNGGIEFATPSGSAYPVNDVVTIQSVFVNFDDTANTAGYIDGLLDGNDLASSFIYFSNGSLPCPAGTVYEGNKIYLPDGFSSSCTVQINIPGTASVNTDELTIEPVSCGTLQTSVLRGNGNGFESIDPAVLGTFAYTDDGAAFLGFDFSALTSSIDVNYPTTTVEGAKTFQIHVELASDISSDPINGIDSRAEIVANNGGDVYEIKIRNEGTGNEAQTALNFAYIFNDLLGSDSPFIAFPLSTNSDVIRLQATEMGVHANSYQCIIDGTDQTPCFTHGADGTPGTAGEGVMTTPLKLDNEVLQGDSAIVFANNSAGEIEWISSHPSILEVTTLSEAAQQDEGTADFVDTNVGIGGSVTLANGSYLTDNCKSEYSDATPPVLLSESCDTAISVPATYSIAGIDYTVNISIGDEIVPVTVHGSELTGFLEGSSTYTSGGGAGYALTGTVTGVVSGSISGTYSGTVTGQVQATINGTGSMAGQDPNELQVADFVAPDLSVILSSTGVLTDVPGSFTSTVKKADADVSHVAIMYAKRPGTSILTAMDGQGCIASFDIDVIQKKVILQMIGRQLGDVLDVSDTVQINALTGGANSEINEYENITASSGIEWFSSNEEVATIDETGLLTALRPGVTNITARYDTGDTEIGTIESDPMQITVNKISNLRVTFDKNTEDLLPALTVDNAHKSVIVAVHNSQAAGQTMLVEGTSVNITLPAATYANDLAKVEAIADALAASIGAVTNSALQPAVNVTRIDGYPGMLILQPINQSADHDGDTVVDIDENGIIDISTTALETNLSILPTYNNAVPLPASETYGLMVIAQYDNGASKLLSPTEFSWVNTPVNYLEQASLDSGLIKLGEISGTSTVVAKYENADGSIVQSNYLTITVNSGPVIDFVRRIGSGSVTKGSRITLQTKVSDVDTVDDITSISTSLVYSTYSTYQQINEDAAATWFTATPFLEQVQMVDQGTTGDGEEAGDTTTPQPVALQYKTYNIPIEIPVDANLFDGYYKLILSISDASNHTLNYVYPIRIGQIGAGDVDGNGVTNMVDVIKAFQIAAGINQTPTASELEAANVDGVGGVTLIDVILLFNTVTKKP